MKNLLVIKEKDPSLLVKATSLRRQGRDAAVLLMLDAVYLAREPGEHAEVLRDCLASGVDVHLLEEDIAKRGIESGLAAGINLVDFGGLVDLLFKDEQRVLNL
ncbi:MAG: DsrH/TusB family sulfur metabolism protein [Candidatus Bathyarchaeota archaeon]|jgi:sulfur relay protein TusB/DsrH